MHMHLNMDMDIHLDIHLDVDMHTSMSMHMYMHMAPSLTVAEVHMHMHLHMHTHTHTEHHEHSERRGCTDGGGCRGLGDHIKSCSIVNHVILQPGTAYSCGDVVVESWKDPDGCTRSRVTSRLAAADAADASKTLSSWLVP